MTFLAHSLGTALGVALVFWCDAGRLPRTPRRWPGEPRVEVRYDRGEDSADVWCDRPMTRIVAEGSDYAALPEGWPPQREWTVWMRGAKRFKVWSKDDAGKTWAKWIEVRK